MDSDAIPLLPAEEMPLLALKCVHLFSSSAIALSTYFLMLSACWEIISPEALVSESSTTSAMRWNNKRCVLEGF